MADKKPHARGRAAHVPTDETRAKVEDMQADGAKLGDVAKALGISVPCLYKHYRDLLEEGIESQTAQVRAALFKNCLDGNVTAQIFWMKVRGRWREEDREISPEPTMKEVDVS